MKTAWAVILCKFTDDNSEPFPKQYYQDLFTTNDVGSKWNMVKYFADCAHGLDLTGTKVFGWYQLDKSVDDYNALGGSARTFLVQWARDLATAHGVDLSPFFSTVVCTNLWGDIGAAPDLSGVIVQGTTPTPAGLGHEMGHVYGLQHSRIDGTTTDYTDKWDIMSAFNDYYSSDTEFKTIGPAFNAWNMRTMGWLKESRVWKQASGSFDETLTLRPLPRPDLSGWLAAELDGYLVEFRAKDGWDAAIPRSAVLLHRWGSDGHSYLMKNSSGVSDLVEGDSFGDDFPANPSPFVTLRRLDVISVGPSSAQVRLRYHEAFHPVFKGLAIDPMALVLSPQAYQIWVEAHHPHVPKVADVEVMLSKMSHAEQQVVVARAKELGEVAAVVLEAAARATR